MQKLSTAYSIACDAGVRFFCLNLPHSGTKYTLKPSVTVDVSLQFYMSRTQSSEIMHALNK